MSGPVDHPLTGKVVIITGASSGIGAATARALAGLGCRLTLAAPPSDRLQALAAELGPHARAIPTDVTVAEDVARMAAQTSEHFGRIDVLFANAGLYFRTQVRADDPEAWRNLIDVNVTGVMRCVHAVLPTMLAQHSGDIVITSSVSGVVDMPKEPIYSAAKHAVQAFTHTLRRQVAPHGIRVGTVTPGRVADRMTGMTDTAQIEARVQAHSHLRAEDVAEAVVFMLSCPPHVTIRDLVMLPQNQDV
jgi:ribitol 2-dehydrogenase